jgi:pSer/pThr/pTyr-binding forkhead associated (FHA) protein
MKAELVPENGDPPIPIVRDLTVIGRHESCDVVIASESLSKRHCVMVKTDGLLVIRDLATTNGTKVKGQRIRWAALLPEDRISLGGYKIRIYLGSDDMPTPSEQRRERAQLSAPPAALQYASTTVRPGGGIGTTPQDGTAVPVANGRESAPANVDSDFLGKGFEIIDDEDEIIDLD